MNFCLLLKNSFKNVKKEQRKSHLTIAEKGWIVQHAEKNPSLSGRRLAVDFTVKFDWPIIRATIYRILKQKKEIHQICTTETDLNKNKVKQLSTGVFQFQSDLAEKLNQVWVRTNITYDIVTLAGKDLQSQPKYSENESVQKLKFSQVKK